MINKYAFSNLKMLRATIRTVAAESERNLPNFALIYPNIRFTPTQSWANENKEISTRLSRMLDYFADPGVRALANAAEAGDVKEIDRLVASGVNVNAVGSHGMTPLKWAMIARSHDSFLRLLERGRPQSTKRRG